MAQRKKQQEKDVLHRLADSGEEALQKVIGELPGGSKVVGAANSLFTRVDELTRRMRSLDPLERRVSELERRLDALDQTKAPAKRATAAKPKRKPAAPRARKAPES